MLFASAHRSTHSQPARPGARTHPVMDFRYTPHENGNPWYVLDVSARQIEKPMSMINFFRHHVSTARPVDFARI
jgi:hypothetical protein